MGSFGTSARCVVVTLTIAPSVATPTTQICELSVLAATLLASSLRVCTLPWASWRDNYESWYEPDYDQMKSREVALNNPHPYAVNKSGVNCWHCGEGVMHWTHSLWDTQQSTRLRKNPCSDGHLLLVDWDIHRACGRECTGPDGCMCHDPEADGPVLEVACPVGHQLPYVAKGRNVPSGDVIWAPGLEPYPFDAMGRYGEVGDCPGSIADPDFSQFWKPRHHIKIAPCTITQCGCLPVEKVHWDRCPSSVPGDCLVLHEVGEMGIEHYLFGRGYQFHDTWEEYNWPPTGEYPLLWWSEGSGEDYEFHLTPADPDLIIRRDSVTFGDDAGTALVGARDSGSSDGRRDPEIFSLRREEQLRRFGVIRN